MTQTITMFDQLQFPLACGHPVVLGRLQKSETWKCEKCGEVTDLRLESHRATLEEYRDRAQQLDAQARERGETVVRAYGGD
jgi:hypothetical protein